MSPATSFAAYLQNHPDFQDVKASTSRLPSLYSDLSRHRQSDPAAHRANVEWWRKILTDVLKHGWQEESARACLAGPSAAQNGKGKARETNTNRLVLRVDEQLKERWTLDNVGRPLGLGTVISELQKQSQFLPKRDFLLSAKPVTGSKKRSGISLDPRPLVASAAISSLEWAMSQLGLGSSGDDDEDNAEDARSWREAVKAQDWVCWEALHEAAQTVIQEHYENNAVLTPFDCLYSRSEFVKKMGTAIAQKWAGEPTLTERDLEVLLKHLERDRRAVAIEKDTIKFAMKKGEPPLPVTDQDGNVVQLKETHVTLERQVKEIERKIEERNNTIKDALRARQEELAKSYLRSRKMLQQLLVQRTKAAEQLGGVLLTIQQAAGDAEIIAAYDLSATTLKGVLSNPALQMDKVDATMDKLAEAIQDHQEIDDAIRGTATAATAQAGVEIDEDEILRELELLEQAEIKETTPSEPGKSAPALDDQTREEEVTKHPEMPSVPSHEPKPLAEKVAEAHSAS